MTLQQKNAQKDSRWPPIYKRRLAQAVVAFLLLVFVAGLWVFKNADESRQNWNNRTPSATVSLYTGAETPAAGDQLSPVVADDKSKPVVADGKLNSVVGDDGQKLAAETETAPALPLPDEDAAEDKSADTVDAPDLAGAAEIIPAPVMSRPAIAEITVIMVDAGTSAARTAEIMEILPPAVALAFSPYARNIDGLTTTARDRGHDILVYLPMEPRLYPKDDPGPHTLLTRNTVEENARHVSWAFSRVKGAKGVMNFMGDKFVEDEGKLSPVMDVLKARNMFFVEHAASTQSASRSITQRLDIPLIVPDIEIDSVVSLNHIQSELQQLERLAQSKGRAVAVASPYPVTIKALGEWIKSLNPATVKIVPLSHTAAQIQKQTTR